MLQKNPNPPWFVNGSVKRFVKKSAGRSAVNGGVKRFVKGNAGGCAYDRL
jgi:hypothetical protein